MVLGKRKHKGGGCQWMLNNLLAVDSGRERPCKLLRVPGTFITLRPLPRRAARYNTTWKNYIRLSLYKIHEPWWKREFSYLRGFGTTFPSSSCSFLPASALPLHHLRTTARAASLQLTRLYFTHILGYAHTCNNYLNFCVM